VRLSKARLKAERRTGGRWTDRRTDGQTALGREPRWQRRIGIHGVQGIAIIPVVINTLTHPVIIAGEWLGDWGFPRMAVTIASLRVNIPSQTGQQDKRSGNTE